MRILAACAAVCSLALAACQAQPVPCLPASVAQCRADLARMAADPRPLPRPVVVIGGWADPGIVPPLFADDLRGAAKDPVLIESVFYWNFTFPSCREKLVALVEAKCPSGNPDETVEVDVVAHSMGGLVARFCAVPAGAPGFPEGRLPEGKRLKIARLFTIGTPHQGANLAPLAPWDPRARDMCRGSDFLAALDTRLDRGDIGELVPYGIEHDLIVGTSRVAPKGLAGIVVPARLPRPSHLRAPLDARIESDIFRRLRGEKGWGETAPSDARGSASANR